MIRFWLLLISVLYVNTAMAHPHVWVDSQYRIAVDQPKIETLEGTWSLDLFTSISLIAEYDVDSDGELTGQEKVDMIDVFTSFENYGYFIKMKQDGVEIVPTGVRILDIRIRDQMLWVRFAITLPTPVNLETSTLSLAFGDDELYFAMEPLEEGLVRLSGALSETCTPIKREAEEMSVASWIDLTCKS
ncbi:ABC transporter substrate-binding protein [Marinomonas ushuaiensis DSM 15871]|uniref:ABC transporter substrate-binding protein n=1 Tax=Marinomonas ushuaiensis DSM 15871 TaxID=1122207 RepID=X7E8L4_9GAMM|nr:DUF1007 family protein [Marinomonas ushuaiensis]ETX12297.1 ABC transporter substrate-binding protein [Marinomonas ushuaiensis DSM 15871]